MQKKLGEKQQSDEQYSLNNTCLYTTVQVENSFPVGTVANSQIWAAVR